jgi:hypothetical protein
MATETETQGSMTQTLIWVGVMIVAVGLLAYFAT